jgi:hypothetical protein
VFDHENGGVRMFEHLARKHDARVRQPGTDGEVSDQLLGVFGVAAGRIRHHLELDVLRRCVGRIFVG